MYACRGTGFSKNIVASLLVFWKKKKSTPHRHSVWGVLASRRMRLCCSYDVASAADVLSTGFFLPFVLALGAADSSTTSSVTTGAILPLPGSLTFLATLPSCLTIFRNSSGFVSNVLSPSGHSERVTSPPSTTRLARKCTSWCIFPVASLHGLRMYAYEVPAFPSGRRKSAKSTVDFASYETFWSL